MTSSQAGIAAGRTPLSSNPYDDSTDFTTAIRRRGKGRIRNAGLQLLGRVDEFGGGNGFRFARLWVNVILNRDGHGNAPGVRVV